MKTLPLLMLALLLSSCGKNGGNSNDQQRQTEESDSSYLEASSQNQIELLNITLNERVDIAGDRIHFSRAVSTQDTGDRITCGLSIAEGEIWTFARSRSGLSVMLPSGQSLSMSAISSTGAGPQGSWLWKGKENGMNIIRRLTFVQGKLVINQACEG